MIVGSFLGRNDVIVIGGGIVGCATAFYLARRGLSVRIIERGRIADEQSSRAWGFVRQQGRHPAEVPLAAEASRIWERLTAELQADVEFVRSGIVVPAETDGDEARLAEAARTARSYGLGTRMLSTVELNRLMPELNGKWRGALFTAEDGHAEPRKATEAFAAAAERLGVEVDVNTPVATIETRNGSVSAVWTAKGRYEADAVVCACGGASSRLLRTTGVSIPIQVVRASVAQTRPSPRFTSIALWGPYVSFRPKPDGSFYIGNGYRGVGADYEITLESLRHLRLFLAAYRRNWRLLRLRLGKGLIDELRPLISEFRSPESRTTLFRVPPEPKPNFEKVRHNERRFYELFPHLSGLGIARSWAGWVDLTPDLIPIIDAIKKPNRLYVAAGFSGHGFALGPVIGKLLSELIVDGRPSLDLRKFRLSRFAEGDFALPSGAL